MKVFASVLLGFCTLAVPARAQAPAADSTRIYELTEVEQPPRASNMAELREALAASYPAAMLQSGTSGTVLVSFVVGVDGAPRDPRVLTSTDSAFDAPTVTAIQGLRFAPARLADRAVPVRAQMNIQWQPPAPVADQGAILGARRTDEGERLYTMNQVVADGGRLYEMREVEVPPRPINLAAFRRQLERTYPPHLRDSRVQAQVHVRMLVDTAGVPHDIHVIRTTHTEFNRPTLENIATLRFRPARVDGKPVYVWVELPIEWSVSATPRSDPFQSRGAQDRP